MSLQPHSKNEIQHDSMDAAPISKPVILPQSERSETVAERSVSKTELSDEAQLGDTLGSLLIKAGFSAEDETAFWKWLATEYFEENSTEEQVDTVEISKGADDVKIPSGEFYNMVIDIYNLRDIVEIYGIEEGFCPKCGESDFNLMTDAKTGRIDYWCCFNCKNGIFHVIDFVAWMEGIDTNDAFRYLVGDADLPK